MSDRSDGIPLLSYAAMVWRRRLLVLLVTVLMVVPAYAVSAVQTRQYAAQAQILLSSQKIDENFNIDTASLTDTQVGNLIAILTSTEVAAAARGRDGTADVSAVGKASSNLVTITAVDSSPGRATTTIDAYVAAFSDYLTRSERQTLDAAAAQQENRIARATEQLASAGSGEQTRLQEQLASLQDQLGRIEAQRELVTAGVTVVQAPVASAEPVSPTPVRNALLALVLGLALGLSLAILLETLHRRAAEPPPAPAAPAPAEDVPRHRAPSPVDATRTDRLPVVAPASNGSGPVPDLRRARRPSPNPQRVEPRQT